MTDPQQFDEKTLVYLRALSTRYPTIDATLAAIARLKAILTLRKGTIHVISDVHGEFKKFIHVVNNASGRLRQLVEEVFGVPGPKPAGSGGAPRRGRARPADRSKLS